MSPPVANSASPIGTTVGRLARHPAILGPIAITLVYAVVICIVDPVREVAIQDDWAYALTVRRLVETGEYRPHDWISANMILQAYWGALLVKLFGYSFTTLRGSTLILYLVGLLSFYQLLRDFGAPPGDAALLAVGLLASPLSLLFAFTFNTDIQWLTWLIASCWLYARALRCGGIRTMGLASIAAAAAIATRQSGTALLVGLMAAWLCDPDRITRARLYVAGAFLPAAAAVWQAQYVGSNPTVFMTLNIAAQAAHFQDVAKFIGDALWRPTVILQFLGIFLLPVAPLMVLANFRRRCAPATTADRVLETSLTPGEPERRQLQILIVAIGYLVAGIVYGYVTRGVLMPSINGALGIYWTSLDPNIPMSVLGPLTAVLVGCTVVRSCLRNSAPHTRSLPGILVALTGTTILGLNMIYIRFWDQYVIAYLPFVILALPRRVMGWTRAARVVAVGVCLIGLTLSAIWVRGTLDEQEAYWRAAERLRSAGIAPSDVAAKWPWQCYYGAFGEWIALGRLEGVQHARSPDTSFDTDFYVSFLGARNTAANYRLLSSDKAPPLGAQSGQRWRVRETVPFRDVFLRQRYVVTLEALPGISG